MQAAWDRYGEDQFSFGYVVKCSAGDVLRYEQFYLDRLQPEFNTEKMAGSSLGARRTDEQRERLRGRPQSTAKRHDYEGEQLTAAEIASRTGLSVVGVHSRLRNGVSLTRRVQKGPAEEVPVGDRMLSPRQIAAEFALPLTTVYSRLRRGWSGEQLIQPQKHAGGRPRKGV